MPGVPNRPSRIGHDPELSRVVQPDTIVPGAVAFAPRTPKRIGKADSHSNPQSLNRYAYVLNNPVRYMDPNGHYVFEDEPDDPWVFSDAGVRSRYWYTHPESRVGQPSDAEVIAVMFWWARALADQM